MPQSTPRYGLEILSAAHKRHHAKRVLQHSPRNGVLRRRHRLHGVSPTGYDHLKHHRSSRAPAGRHARAAPHDEDTSIAQQLLILDTCNRAALGADGWEPTAAQRRRWTKEVAKAWRNVSSGVPLAEYKWPT